MDENVRQRARKKLLRVTLPDGKVICHKNATMTFVEALMEIGSEDFEKIRLESCHLPLLSKEIYPQYKEWVKPVCDGWYVNTQGDTEQKYMQLTSIKNQLGLRMEVEVGTDFITSDVKIKTNKTKSSNDLLVKFPDGEYIAEENPIDTYLQTIWKIGVDDIKKRGIECFGRPLITLNKTDNRQIQVGEYRWLFVPTTTKDKYKILRIVAAAMRIDLQVTLL